MDILLRRKNKLILPRLEDVDNTAKAMAFAKNVEALGFRLSPLVIKRLSHVSDAVLMNYYNLVITTLKKMVGADKEYNPMYPNFPEQVIEAEDIELFVNALFHYVSGGAILPDYEKNERFPLFEDTTLTEITGGTIDDLWEIFENLLSSKTSLSEQDKEDVAWFFRLCDWQNHLPAEIPFKENVALVGKLFFENTECGADQIAKYFSTATDVLRLMTAFSNGDLSLASKTKYRLNRRERRFVMDLLSLINNPLPDMYKYKFEWLRVGEALHPFEFKNAKYEGVKKAFDTLRNGKKPRFYGAKLHDAIINKETRASVDLLYARPGEFARNLDKVLRDAYKKQDCGYVLMRFADIAQFVSVPVLLQLREFYKHRDLDARYRVFFPKGNIAKAKVIDYNLPELPQDICDQVVYICEDALSLAFRHKNMGKVYISDEFKNFIVPFSQRSTNSTNKIVTRGSRLPVSDNAKVVRPFVWWTNERVDDCFDRRVDIDLSCILYDKDWNHLCHVDYTTWRSNDFGVYHSGDIIDGGASDGNGVAEFIDLDIEEAKEAGARYVVFGVFYFNSDTSRYFSDLEHLSFGFMEREAPQSGEIFEPRTVKMNMSLSSRSQEAIPVIFDLETRQFIWADMQISLNRGYYNVANSLNAVTANCYAIVNCNKPNLYDLISLNAEASGTIVSNRNEADIIFDNDTTKPTEIVDDVEIVKDVPIITAYDVDYVVGNLF